jgi:hypothetical protein
MEISKRVFVNQDLPEKDKPVNIEVHTIDETFTISCSICSGITFFDTAVPGYEFIFSAVAEGF